MLPDVMFSAVSNCFIKTHSPGTGEASFKSDSQLGVIPFNLFCFAITLALELSNPNLPFQMRLSILGAVATLLGVPGEGLPQASVGFF